MPHLLIAGSTGSGKSVCINTLIMSILYNAYPDDVQMIMIDPKVVELSVYNGIPHLLIPVVNDPKQAASALHWAVSKMEERYHLFANYGVRDLKGYNAKVGKAKSGVGAEEDVALPQIVIIVDELADLMMVAAREVEESICRLAQKARAAGIHLVLATQRPSVDVITGLIKANMPSRIAFAVSSGIDSRTILDSVDAAKLLGRGDMLFYPQGYPRPVRLQGAFVSDNEVSEVVDFLKANVSGYSYDREIMKDIEKSAEYVGVKGKVGQEPIENDDERDDLFAEVGWFIMETGKASIGNLQRRFRIGFNRAARIMDQLCEAGVVGPDEGTKARTFLMNSEQFGRITEKI
jgi:S-DNA-T family DNA segregation ATPase FtsK/SpoIIIE